MGLWWSVCLGGLAVMAIGSWMGATYCPGVWSIGGRWVWTVGMAIMVAWILWMGVLTGPFMNRRYFLGTTGVYIVIMVIGQYVWLPRDR